MRFNFVDPTIVLPYAPATKKWLFKKFLKYLFRKWYFILLILWLLFDYYELSFKNIPLVLWTLDSAVFDLDIIGIWKCYYADSLLEAGMGLEFTNDHKIRGIEENAKATKLLFIYKINNLGLSVSVTQLHTLILLYLPLIIFFGLLVFFIWIYVFNFFGWIWTKFFEAKNSNLSAVGRLFVGFSNHYFWVLRYTSRRLKKHTNNWDPWIIKKNWFTDLEAKFNLFKIDKPHRGFFFVKFGLTNVMSISDSILNYSIHFWNLFFYKSYPRVFWKILLVISCTYILLIFPHDIVSLYLLSLYILIMVWYRWKYIWTYKVYRSIGLKIKWITVYFHKPTILSSDQFFDKMYFWRKTDKYLVFASFIPFFFSNIVLIKLYVSCFFGKIVTWNGYFYNTLLLFFFNGKDTLENSSSLVNFDFFLGFDGLNIWLIWLTSLLVFLSCIFLFEQIKNFDFYAQMAWVFFLQFASFQFFCVYNYLWMYIFFELSLLPIFVLIVLWGSNWWKIHAALQMLLFTFIGSVLLLTGILLLFTKLNTFNCYDIFFATRYPSSENFIFSFFEKKLIWIFLFIGFAVKTPLYPFHIWLPEAHSEAPTVGSVLLAGVLLKMGTYGFMRFVLPLFPEVLIFFKTILLFMCLSGIIFSSLAALAQIDIKKIIAYSSIGHMGLVLLGLISMNMNGFLGASFMMISHGLISSAMFFSIGMLYKIYGTRSIVYFTSLAHFMPNFSICFFFFNLANMGFPGTMGFPAEILIFSSLIFDNFFYMLIVAIGSIFGTTYSIWLITRTLYGQINSKISTYWDLKPIEWRVLIPLAIYIVIFGFFPFIILDFFKPFCGFFLAI